MAKEVIELLVYKNGDKEFKIKIGDNITYLVTPKYDADAPSGFKDFRTTKVLDPDVKDKINLASYDVDRGVFDTGLTKYSKVLVKLYPDEENRQRALQQITKYILNPLVDLKGSNSIDPANFEFWDDFGIEVGVDQSFNTSNPLELYYIFILILRGKIAPVGLESEPSFREAQFAVENKDTVIDMGQRRELEKNKAVGKFMNLLDTDAEGLEAMLEWIGVPGVAGAEEALVNTIFTQWLQADDNQNPKQFLEVYKNYYETESGKKVLTIFKNLRKLERAKLVKRVASGIELSGEILGKNMKESAENVVKDAELLQKVYDIIDAQDK